jgi:hypothetical protein
MKSAICNQAGFNNSTSRKDSPVEKNPPGTEVGPGGM